MAASKDVYLISGKTSNFHLLRSNGILWVSSNMVYMKNPAAWVAYPNLWPSLYIWCLELPEGLYYLEKVEIRGVSKKWKDILQCF